MVAVLKSYVNRVDSDVIKKQVEEKLKTLNNQTASDEDYFKRLLALSTPQPTNPVQVTEPVQQVVVKPVQIKEEEPVTYISTGTSDLGYNAYTSPTATVSIKPDTSGREVKRRNNIVMTPGQLKSSLTAAYKKAGLNPDLIKGLIAKNLVESTQKNGMINPQGQFNFGNITVGGNKTVRYFTGQDVNGKGKPISNKFRWYDSVDDYVRDELSLLSKTYKVNNTDNAQTLFRKLKGKTNGIGTRDYAEAKDYEQLLKSKYNRI